MSSEKSAISSFKWSFIDVFSRYFLSFIIGIILARILNPEDYGLFGITGIFMSISRVFIDGGFSDALIRKQEPTRDEYSSVFLFNLTLALVFYFVFFFSSPTIAHFFNDDRLIDIIKVVGLSLIISSCSIIQVIKLRKNLDFKSQAIVGFFSNIISGIFSIFLAYKDYGVWSLIYGGILSNVISTLLLWVFNRWKPSFTFKYRLVSEHFKFGSKIMLGSFVNIIYDNMFYVLIGKIFNPTQLGYYTKADNFQKLPVSTIDIIVRQVTYPLLSKFQNDNEKLKKTYMMIIQLTSFLVFVLMLGFAVVAESFVCTLIGEKWLQSVSYLQLLCFVGVFYPLISININILNVKGRSDLSLIIYVLKIIVSIPSLIVAIYFGVKYMIFGLIIASFLLFVILVFLTSKMIDYSFKNQMYDIMKSMFFGIAVVTPVFVFSLLMKFDPRIQLLFLMTLGLISLIIIGELSKNKEYEILKTLIVSKAHKMYFKKKLKV